MSPRASLAALALSCLAALGATACGATTQLTARSNALTYLYPKGSPPIPPGDVRLTLPVRVGVGFAPTAAYGERFSATQKQALLTKMSEAFRGSAGIAGVEVIPPNHLTPEGGFQDLDRLKAAFGVDLVALVSYDQVQYGETTTWSWTYWTIVGAYAVEGQKDETRTLMDAVVFHVPSRALLFNATGQSVVAGRATPIRADREQRQRSENGFDLATDDLIVNMKSALAAFQEQAATGTVRGPGTPAITMVDAAGQPIGAAGSSGGGAFGPIEILAAAALGLAACVRRGSRPRR